MTRKCLTCGGEISEEQDEEMVLADRSVHANYEDCQAELRRPSATGSALRSYRLRQRSGLVPRHQSVSQQEMSDRD